MNTNPDPFRVKNVAGTSGASFIFYRINRLEESGFGNISRLPYSIKILLESLLRNLDGKNVTREDVESLSRWNHKKIPDRVIPFIPARVVMQDFTGVPVIVDLAAMRSAMKRFGKSPPIINPVVPADMVIDHSVQVDYFGTSYARSYNEQKEFERNGERYAVLRWGQKAFNNFRVVPPGRGIVHQVNLEYLSSLVKLKNINGEMVAYPDTLVGTDSHTTMVNSLGVLGWGVGGIEAEAVLLGQPYYMPVPEVVGVKLYGELKEGVTSTDLVLHITKILREYGVVGKFVEFYGPGLSKLSLSDRATISNMAPEFGATAAFFPIDIETLDYLKRTGRKKEHIDLVELYAKEQGIFFTEDAAEPVFSSTMELDMGTVNPGIAGPKRPQDCIPLGGMSKSFHDSMKTFDRDKNVENNDEHEFHRWLEEGGSFADRHTHKKDSDFFKEFEEIVPLTNGSIVIAALTSCTNTSNPFVMIAAGLLAKKAVKLGLKVKPYVKTTLAPGSRVVTDYLELSGLLPYLEALGFHLVGYGCTTCIGNSGPIPGNVEKVVLEKDLVVAAVLSGNRNFEGRINPLVKANYLASPPLVVAYAICGTVDIDLDTEPLGYDPNGKPVHLKDVWPKKDEIEQVFLENISPGMFEKHYSEIFDGTELWDGLDIQEEELYRWDTESTYIREPPFFQDFNLKSSQATDIKGARLLALLGDSITTDHISPAGAIPVDSPAGQYLVLRGVEQDDFNSFGSRRGNHEVMMRGTFGNIRLKNRLTPDKEGGWTQYFPTGKDMTIYDAAMLYREKYTPLIIIAGKEYGTGSSRDWAAKGTSLLGVKAVIAESFERIHRSNLVGMGVLPLQFMKGENADTIGIKGDEIFEIPGSKNPKPGGELTVIARSEEGLEKTFKVIARLDLDVEVEYYRNGGILQTFLRKSINGE